MMDIINPDEIEERVFGNIFGKIFSRIEMPIMESIEKQILLPVENIRKDIETATLEFIVNNVVDNSPFIN